MSLLFFINDTATTEIYTLSLHDALPIFVWIAHGQLRRGLGECVDDLLVAAVVGEDPCLRQALLAGHHEDRKSTRLNSSHSSISYAVFCLKKKIKIFACEFISCSWDAVTC